MTDRRQKILVVESVGLGDFVSMLPALKSLRRHLGSNVEVTLAVQNWVGPFARQMEGVDEVLVVDSGSLRGLFKSALKIRQQKYDLVVAFHPSRKNTLLSLAARKRSFLGYRVLASSIHYSYRDNRYFYSKGWLLKRAEQAKVGVSLYEMASKVASLLIPTPVSIAVPFIKPGATQLQQAASNLNRLGLVPNRYIVLHALSSKSTKNWPAPHIKEFVSLIWQKLSVPVLLIGDTKDKSAIEAIASEFEPTQCTSLMSPIDHLTGVFGQCLAFVGVDSGPLHIAMAMNVPSVGLFGRTEPFTAFPQPPFNPLSSILYRAHPCRCSYEACVESNRCMDLIGAGEVMSSLEELLVKAKSIGEK